MIRHLAIAPIVMAASPALAIDQTYVGVWAPTLKQCSSSDRTAFRITPHGMDGREWSCDTKKASSGPGGWVMHMSCATEGVDHSAIVRWRIEPNGHLHEVQNGKQHDYARCKDSDYRPDSGD